MFFLSYRNREHQPSTNKLWNEYRKGMDLDKPEGISLETVSHLSQEIFSKMGRGGAV
jgi:hypothetical protein